MALKELNTYLIARKDIGSINVLTKEKEDKLVREEGDNLAKLYRLRNPVDLFIALNTGTFQRITNIANINDLRRKNYQYPPIRSIVGKKENIDDQVRQIGQYMAKQYGIDNIDGIASSLTSNPYPDRGDDVLNEFSAVVALRRLPIPVSMGDACRDWRQHYISALQEEQKAVRNFTNGTLQRNDTLLQMIQNP